ncbi:MAG TPA: FkbM family methyltransferase [Chitinophagaceae bacterium]|nr:FkbM family methyltransferase [Chitinophagaceae bacterium]
MSSFAYYTAKVKQRFFTRLGREKSRIRKLPRHTEGQVTLFGKKFTFHDNLSFLDSYKEIFEHEIYRFPDDGKGKTILDCGANMGLSVLFFAINYPDHQIIAFEPDDAIYPVLKKNVAAYDLKNVQLIKKAVWNKEEVLEFFTDAGMGGRIGDAYSNQPPKRIEAVRLRDFISDDTSFLKIDIEGAEYQVLTDCRDVLKKVNRIFFEYHGHYKDPQTLHELLLILRDNGFHYYIKESSTRSKPFVERGLICEAFDMAINIFGYRDPLPAASS